MKISTLAKIALVSCACCLVTPAISAPAFTQPRFSSSMAAFGENYIENTSGGYYDFGGQIDKALETNSTGSSGTISGSRDFTGIDVDGVDRTLTMTYDSGATASSSGLHAYATASITNNFYPYPLYNNPFALNADGDIDENGMPVSFSIWSQAGYVDTALVTGAPDLSFIRLMLHVDGLLENGGIYVSTGAFNGTSWSSRQPLFLAYASQSVDAELVSIDIPVIDGTATFSLSLTTFVDLPTLSIDVSGFSDFSNTLTVERAFGYNGAGDQVSLASFIGSDGTSFETALISDTGGNSVPEPASLSLLGLGLGIGLLTRRAKRLKRFFVVQGIRPV